jgi:hypothetical protein
MAGLVPAISIGKARAHLSGMLGTALALFLDDLDPVSVNSKRPFNATGLRA